MKLFKKILTSFCALTMAMTVVSSFAIVASAEGTVTAYPVITVDTENKTATIEVHVKNVPETVDGAAQYVDYVVVTTDVSSYSTVNLAEIEDNYFESGFSNSWPTVAASETPGYFSYQLSFNSGKVAKRQGAAATEDILLYTLVDIPLTDAALKDGFEVKFLGVDHNIGFAITTSPDGNEQGQYKYLCNKEPKQINDLLDE